MKLRGPVVAMLAVVVIGFFIAEYVLRSGPPTQPNRTQAATLTRLARQSAEASRLLHVCGRSTCVATDWTVMTTSQGRLATYSAGLAALLAAGSCRTALTGYATFLRAGDRLASTWLASTYPLTIDASRRFATTYFDGQAQQLAPVATACRLPALRRIAI